MTCLSVIRCVHNCGGRTDAGVWGLGPFSWASSVCRAAQIAVSARCAQRDCRKAPAAALTACCAGLRRRHAIRSVQHRLCCGGRMRQRRDESVLIRTRPRSLSGGFGGVAGGSTACRRRAGQLRRRLWLCHPRCGVARCTGGASPLTVCFQWRAPRRSGQCLAVCEHVRRGAVG
jgi:hypothetical protein